MAMLAAACQVGSGLLASVPGRQSRQLSDLTEGGCLRANYSRRAGACVEALAKPGFGKETKKPQKGSVKRERVEPPRKPSESAPPPAASSPPPPAPESAAPPSSSPPPPPKPLAASAAPTLRPGSDTVAAVTRSPDELDFERKLAELRRAGTEQLRTVQKQEFSAIDYDAVLDSPDPSRDSEPSWFEKPLARAGLAVGVVVLGAAFILGDFAGYSGGGGAPRRSPTTELLQSEGLTDAERTGYEARLAEFQQTLEQEPSNREALEGAAVSLAELGEFSRSAEYLEKLVEMGPPDPEALRLLGEVRAAMGKYQESVQAYRLAIQAAPQDELALLTGLADALITDGQASEAVNELLEAKQRLGSAGGGASATDLVQVDLLLGRAYLATQRVEDAVALYDSMARRNPQDFRPVLAKALLYKEQGKDAEAQRLLVQARTLAPEKARAVIDRLSGR